jgi:hypothetical protein
LPSDTILNGHSDAISKIYVRGDDNCRKSCGAQLVDNRGVLYGCSRHDEAVYAVFADPGTHGTGIISPAQSNTSQNDADRSTNQLIFDTAKQLRGPSAVGVPGNEPDKTRAPKLQTARAGGRNETELTHYFLNLGPYCRTRVSTVKDSGDGADGDTSLFCYFDDGDSMLHIRRVASPGISRS